MMIFLYHNLAKKENTSSYLIERPQLSGKDSVVQQEFNNRIVIMENDNALSLLLTTTLGLKGYVAETLSEIEEIKTYNPALIILDTGEEESLAGLEICKQVKQINSKIKVITTSIYHNKEQIMNAGSDIYLPKPYNIDTLNRWVDLAIKEFNT